MMNGLLLCHEAAELLLPQGFDDPRAALGMLALEAEPQQRAAQVRGRGGETDAALGCDEEMEEDMMAVDGAQQLGVPTRWRGPQHQQYLAVTMAEPSAIRAPHPAAPTGSGALTRPPMDPQATRAPLPMPPPPRALGRSQSLPAYHTSVNYHGGGVNGLGARQPHHTHHQYEPPHPRPQPQLAAAALLPPPPPPPFLLRQRSFSCLSRPYRSTTGRFLSENLARVEEAAPREDVAERVVTMHAQERDYYAPSLAYFHRLETDPLLAQWRRGAVRWFSKVVEHLHANREAIATATNFLDRHFGSRLYPATAPSQLLPPPLELEQDHDQAAFERTAACALALSLKMHQGDSTASLAPRLAALTSVSSTLTPRALCALEFEMVGALGRYLNPPTPGTLIHHLLHFLPSDDDDLGEGGGDKSDKAGSNNHSRSSSSRSSSSRSSNSNSNRPLLLALDDHANDLALMALETPVLAAFPVSVVAVAAILASFARLRADGANKWLDPTLELRWLQALDANDLKVEPDEITECLEQLGRQAKKAAAAASSPTGARSGVSAAAAAASQVGVGSPLSGVEGLYLPTYLYPPTERKGASSTPATPGPNREKAKMARALSPTGVDEIDAMLSGSGDGAARDGAEGGHQEVMLVA